MIKFCIFHDFFGVGGFCPNEKSTLSYVYHYRKHSYRSSFVFWGILSWGDFVPTTSITLNIHIEQHMFWEDFVPRVFYPVTDLVLCFGAPLLLPIKICDFRRFCPQEDFVPTLYVHHIVQIHVEQLMCLGGFCPWEDFIPQSPSLMLED